MPEKQAGKRRAFRYRPGACLIPTCIPSHYYLTTSVPENTRFSSNPSVDRIYAEDYQYTIAKVNVYHNVVLVHALSPGVDCRLLQGKVYILALTAVLVAVPSIK